MSRRIKETDTSDCIENLGFDFVDYDKMYCDQREKQKKWICI